MANPLTVQGTLNRLRGSVVYAIAPDLNVTSSYLAREAISISFDGDTSQLIGTLTGAVTSPEPYTYGTVTIHLLRSQHLADQYKRRIETNTTMGRVTIHGDSNALGNFTLNNCVLMSLQELAFDGNQATFIVRLRGIYNINDALFAAS
jgi:hypothetical protein